MSSNNKHRSYLANLLSRKDYSRKQLEDKLQKHGATLVEAKELIADFSEMGLFKEDAFKMSRTRGLLKKNLGSRAINFKLRTQKESISPSELAQVYEDLDMSSGQQIQTLIEKQLRRLNQKDLSAYEKKGRIIQFLLSKGHSMSEITAELKKHTF